MLQWRGSNEDVDHLLDLIAQLMNIEAVPQIFDGPQSILKPIKTIQHVKRLPMIIY